MAPSKNSTYVCITEPFLTRPSQKIGRSGAYGVAEDVGNRYPAVLRRIDNPTLGRANLGATCAAPSDREIGPCCQDSGLHAEKYGRLRRTAAWAEARRVVTGLE